MHIKNLKNKLTLSSIAIAGIMLTGCGWVHDDLPQCPAQLQIRFVYDYNLKWADAFAHEVTSVNVWAFDESGQFVWSGNANGAELAQKDYYLETPLTEGKYDFVSWCGLYDNKSFDLATYTPTSKEELEVKLNTISKDGENVSDTQLGNLYHGYVSNVVYEIDPNKPTYKVATIPLMRDTKNIIFMLQHLDGSPIDNRDFTVTITDNNGVMDWNNNIIDSPLITYKPWDVVYGQVTSPEDNSRAVTTVASLRFDLSTGRLMADSNAILTVHRNWDDRDIIRIPLIDYLLLVKGHYGDISDQEYLDRQDDYSMIFFIDKHSNWYQNTVIYINSWAVVPPQNNEF